MSLRDNEAKVRLGYLEKDSIVWMDGREKLVGRDWRKRKQELWDRADGRCEYVGSRMRCISEGHDPHHLSKRWPLRDDRLSNLQLLCRRHHEMLDSRKVRWTEHEPTHPYLQDLL